MGDGKADDGSFGGEDVGQVEHTKGNGADDDTKGYGQGEPGAKACLEGFLSEKKDFVEKDGKGKSEDDGFGVHAQDTKEDR